MSFAQLNSDGLSIACFLVDQDWRTKPSISFFFPVDVTAGLSGRQSRRPEAEELLLTVAFKIIAASEDEAQALRQQFATLGTGWVGVPLFIDQFLGADVAAPGARWADAQRFIDLTTPAIVAHDAELVADHTYAPLLVGHITDLPSIEPADVGIATCAVVVTEDSPWAFRIGILGEHVAGTWPESLAPDWASAPTQTPAKELKFARIGLQREQTIAGEEHAFEWHAEAGFTLHGKTDIAALLGFFRASRGAWQPFTSRLWWEPGTATAEAPHETTLRFAERVLKLEFTDPAIAHARVKFSQVPWEIVGTAGEEPLQPPRLYLYKLTHKVPVTPEVWRYTSCWRPLTRTSDGTYTPAPMLHDEIVGAIDGRTANVTLDSFLFDGSPLARFNPLTLEAPLELEILAVETDPIDADAAVQIWRGTIPNAPAQGRRFSAECAWEGGLMDQELPRVRISTYCQTCLFSPYCGLSKAAFTKTGTLTAAAGCYVTIATAAADAANVFAHGAIELGAGATWERRAILASTPVAGGQQLVLESPLRQAADGQAVSFHRGCDRTAATCKALGNFPQFRGFPNLAKVNLSLPGMTTSGQPRGKK